MTDTNGYVAPEHLILFNGILVSKVIYPRLVAASLDFHRQGYTFSVAYRYGGYRPFDVQGGMQAAFDAGQFGVAPYYLNAQSSSRPADEGHSRHGFGLAVDPVTNAPTAKRDEILHAHGFHLLTPNDPNHFEPDGINVLVAPPESAFAALDQSEVNSTQEDNMQHPVEIFHVTSTGGIGGAFLAIGNHHAANVSESTANWLASRYNDGGLPFDIDSDHVHWLASTVYGIPAGVLEQIVVAPLGAWDPSGVTVPPTFATDIAAAIKVPTPDLTPVLNAIAAGDQSILTAISQVDENTLATFGLKRV